MVRIVSGKSLSKRQFFPHLARRDTPISCKRRKQDQRVRLSFKERRMKIREPTKLHRKSGVWGTHSYWDDNFVWC
jgi:hypothetical protein